MGHQLQDLRDAIDEQKRLRAQSEASELIPTLPETKSQSPWKSMFGSDD